MKVKCTACNTEFEPFIRRAPEGREIKCHVCGRPYHHSPTDENWDNWLCDRPLEIIEPEDLPAGVNVLDFTRNLHGYWFRTQFSKGMKWGEKRTENTHPCMKKDWNEIPETEQATDVGMVLDIFTCLDTMGFQVVPKDKNDNQ